MQRYRGVVCDVRYRPTDRLTGYNLFRARLGNRDIGIYALVQYFKPHDLSSKFDFGFKRFAGCSVICGSFHFLDRVASQRQQFGNCDAALIAYDGVYDIACLIIDFKGRALQERAGRQAVDRVIILGLFGDLNLALLRGIFPYDFRRFAALDAECLYFLVPDITRRSFNLLGIILAFLQIVLQFDITVRIRSVFANDIIVFILDEEAHTADRLTCHRVNLADTDAGKLCIFKGDSGQLTSLDDHILRCAIQTVAVRCFDFGHDIDAILKAGNSYKAGRIARVFTDQLTSSFFHTEFCTR